MKNIVVLILSLLLFTTIFAGATETPNFKDLFQQPLNQWINAEINSDTLMVEMNRLEQRLNTQEPDWERMYWQSRIALIRGQIYYERDEKKMSLQLLDESRQFSEESIAVHETSDAWRIMSEASSLYMLQKGIFYIMQNSALTVEQARKALELDPENARASLIVAQFQYNAPPIAGGDKEEGITQLLDYVSNSNQDFRNTLESRPIEPFLQEFLASHSEDLLARALENLIHNGFKYGEDNTPVSVAATLQHGHFEIAVRNTGLASAKSVIESHGWSISVKSENRETEFRIVIPEELTQNEAS